MGCLEDRVPWIAHAAIDRMRTWNLHSKFVLEFGSGGSTLFFSDRGAYVIAIEHSAIWSMRVQRKSGTSSVKVLVVPPDDQLEQSCRSTMMPGKSFTLYVAMAKTACDDRTPDVILVDGRARSDCMRWAVRALPKGGKLILDDSNRSFYADAIADADATLGAGKTYVGNGPHSKGIVRHTRIWET